MAEAGAEFLFIIRIVSVQSIHFTRDKTHVSLMTAFTDYRGVVAPVPVGQPLFHLYSTGVNKQWGDLDVCAIMKALEHLCGA